jgi:hypothetical protein
MSPQRWWLLAPVAAVAAAGCTDRVKVSEERAVAHAAAVAALVDKDIEEIRRGLPAGAKKLGEIFGTEEVTPGKARAALRKAREAVIDLQLAKSTFFAATDLQGVAHASDLETDGFSGKNILDAYKPLAKAKEGGYVETLGQMEEARGLRKGDDLQWVAAAPVPGADGKPVGLYVTGWSFRRFAQHLEEQLKTDLRNAGPKDEKPPLVYVFVLHEGKAYGTPIAPEVNVQAVEGLGLAAKVQGGTFRGRVEITNRGYGVAAQAVKKLCESCAVVVLRSEV